MNKLYMYAAALNTICMRSVNERIRGDGGSHHGMRVGGREQRHISLFVYACDVHILCVTFLFDAVTRI